jgi:flagellar protein FlaG
VDSNVRIQAAPAPGTPGPDPKAAGKALPTSGDKLPPEAPAAPTPDRVEQAVQQIQSYLTSSQRQLQFQVDPSGGRTIVRVVNPETGEIIRQIPGEEVLKLARTVSPSGGRIISDLV